MRRAQSEQDQGDTRYDPVSIESVRHSKGGLIEYDDLLRRYAEAMIRISQLESQLADITRNQLEGNASSNSSFDARPPVQQLDVGPALKEVAELETRASTESTNVSEREAVSQERSIPPPLSEADIAQLRLQVTSLANTLAQTQDELKRSQGTHVRKRRSHHKHKSESKWGFLRGSKHR